MTVLIEQAVQFVRRNHRSLAWLTLAVVMSLVAGAFYYASVLHGPAMFSLTGTQVSATPLLVFLAIVPAALSLLLALRK